MSKKLSKFTSVFSDISQQHSPSISVIDFPANCQILNLLAKCWSRKQLKEIHAQLILLGFVRYTYITSRLLTFYAVSEYGDIRYAESVFCGIKVPTVFNWNTMIKGYCRIKKPDMSFLVYVKMQSNGMRPNGHTFPILIKACNGLSTISQVQGQIVKFAMDHDVYVVTSLINAYSKYGYVGLARRVFEETRNINVVCWTSLITGYCLHGLVDEARKLFDQMPERTEVSWSAMISGYVGNDCFIEAIQLFHVLKDGSNLMPNQSLLVSVLNACACLGASTDGRWVHSYIDEKGFEYEVELGTALIDFYAKCGCIETAHEVFRKMHRKDVMLWSAMIMGLAINGNSGLALKLFLDMEKSGTKPNAITFIAILTACCHGGLVDEGWRLFESMNRDYRIPPRVEHYGCMVNLLGRAGKIEEAEQLIKFMPIEPDGVIWGSLLNGCMMHGYKELGERVGKHLIEVEPQHSGRYVVLGNMYASMGKWEGVTKLRKLMKERGVMTSSGWSYIELNGDFHRFLAHDKSHPRTREIYGLLNQLNKN